MVAKCKTNYNLNKKKVDLKKKKKNMKNEIDSQKIIITSVE